MREDAPSSLRVLVVEDNPDTAAGLAYLFQAWGHEVVVAHDGHEALRVAGESVPDAVLLDIGLPTMDGFEVARRLRQVPGGLATFIAAASGYNRESDRSRAREAGIDAYLVKPFDPFQLEEVLARRCREAEHAVN